MTVYLGIASFMHILKTLEKRYYMPNNRSVVVSTIKLGSQTFSFAEYSRSPTDCGFIITNTGVLKDIFDDSELSKVLTMCERKHDQGTNITSHCVIKDNSELKKNISTITDGANLNCLHP